MRRIRAKQLKKVAEMITPPRKSVHLIYRRLKKGFTLGHLHLQTINELLQNNLQKGITP